MPIQTKVAGAWKPAVPFARIAGAWKSAQMFVRAGGAWKPAATSQVATPSWASVNFPGAPGDMTAYVTIGCATAGATIYYSISGGAWTVYGSAVNVPPGSTLRAYATKAGMLDSGICGPTQFN